MLPTQLGRLNQPITRAGVEAAIRIYTTQAKGFRVSPSLINSLHRETGNLLVSVFRFTSVIELVRSFAFENYAQAFEPRTLVFSALAPGGLTIYRSPEMEMLREEWMTAYGNRRDTEKFKDALGGKNWLTLVYHSFGITITSTENFCHEQDVAARQNEAIVRASRYGSVKIQPLEELHHPILSEDNRQLLLRIRENAFAIALSEDKNKQESADPVETVAA